MKLTEIYAARRAERMQKLDDVKDAEDPDINLKSQLAGDEDKDEEEERDDEDIDESELQK